MELILCGSLFYVLEMQALWQLKIVQKQIFDSICGNSKFSNFISNSETAILIFHSEKMIFSFCYERFISCPVLRKKIHFLISYYKKSFLLSVLKSSFLILKRAFPLLGLKIYFISCSEKNHFHVWFLKRKTVCSSENSFMSCIEKTIFISGTAISMFDSKKNYFRACFTIFSKIVLKKHFLRTIIENSSHLLSKTKFCLGNQLWKTILLAYSR